MLAQALCASRTLLVLDEPTIGLDLPAEQEFYALLRDAPARTRTRGDRRVARPLALAGAGRPAGVHQPRMHVHGNPDEVVHSHALREAAYSCEFDFIAGEIDHHGRHGPGHRRARCSSSPSCSARSSRRCRSGMVCGVLGFFVVLRRLAFIGVGISHSAIGGVALGLVARRVAARDGRRVRAGRRARHRGAGRAAGSSEDTIIGVFFSGSMALGVVLFSLQRGYQQELFGYLFGNVLAVSTGELVVPGRWAARWSSPRCSPCSARSSSSPSTKRSRALTASAWSCSTRRCSRCSPPPS